LDKSKYHGWKIKKGQKQITKIKNRGTIFPRSNTQG
jgi:hypothetical protein